MSINSVWYHIRYANPPSVYLLTHKFAILSYMKSLSLSQPHIIAIVGTPGSGKTFFADKFSDTFNTPFINKDKITPLSKDTKSAAMLISYQVEELLKTHQSFILEGMSDTRTERMILKRFARKAGYEIIFVWVQTDPTTAKSRATRENTEMNPEEYDRILKRFASPDSTEEHIVISGKHTYATQAKVVLKKLSGPRAEIVSRATIPTRPTKPGHRNIVVS